jgi:3-phenylpropionate/cinnamic acid dioxygenase small subunit
MTDERLRRLADRDEIHELLVRYCVALDRMDLAEVASLFTDDCRVEYGAAPALRSRGSSSLAESLQRLWRWARTSHHLSNVLVAFDDDDSARALSYVIAWHQREDGSTATVFGRYLDRLVRVEGEWRIADRRMEMNGADAGFTLELFPAPRTGSPPGWSAPDL